MKSRIGPRWGLLSLCLVLVIFSLSPVSTAKAQGAQIFVSASGTGTSCTQAAPCLPSQGLTNSGAGDTIYFRFGLYTDPLSDPYLTITKAVTLIGGWDGAPTGDVVVNPTIYATVIDGEADRALFIVNESSGSGGLITISGFRFQASNADVDEGSVASEGGAILVRNGRVDILNNEFLNNYAASYGGAISITSDFDVRIIGNTFDNNVVDYGGGSIMVSSGALTIIENNIFLGGLAQYGSAIHNWDCPIIVNRNVFDEVEGNSVIRLSSYNSESTLSNNIFIRPEQYAIQVSSLENGPEYVLNNTIVGASIGIYVSDSSALHVVNNIITDSGSSIFTSSGVLSGSNNLFYNNSSNSNPLTNPVYADPDFVLPASDDYHINEGSPAENAGAAVSLTTDIDGEMRPSNGGFDIGADEIQGGVAVYLPLLQK